MVITIFPRKFFYAEFHYASLATYSVEAVDGRLELHELTGCIPPLINPPSISINRARWASIESTIRSLNITSISSDSGICDGMEVKCWITFSKRILKFDAINPCFDGFAELRHSINNITICEAHPSGLFYF